MAHMAKYNKGAIGHVCGHYDRSKECGANVIKDRSAQNYNLAPHMQNQLDFIHERLSQVKVQNRKDVNVMCDWIVTLPEPMQDYELEFFRSAYDFLEQKYGKENVVSAWVHMDEATPHMHFAFIPVVMDKKKDRLKVSAKECITRADLQAFHGELENYIADRLGMEVEEIGIQNGATRDGNKSVAQLRRERKIEVIEEELADLKAELQAKNAEISALQAHIDELKSECEELLQWHDNALIKATEDVRMVEGISAALIERMQTSIRNIAENKGFGLPNLPKPKKKSVSDLNRIVAEGKAKNQAVSRANSDLPIKKKSWRDDAR